MVMRGSTLLSLLEIELFGSKYNNRHCSLRRPSFPRLRRCTQLKLKVPGSVQIFIWEGGYSRPTQTQSAKIRPNFHFRRGERWKGGYSRPTQTESAKICPIFHFRGVGVGWRYSRATQTQSAKICPNFHGEGGYSRPTFLKYLSGSTQVFFNQIFNHSSSLLHHR